jgi:signal transduction histidine kinase
LHLFDRFYRAERARTGEGTGLGLAIGRWITEAHHGRIAAANVTGGGAVFTVSLPLVS